MADLNESISKFQELASKFKDISFPTIPDYPLVHNIIPEFSTCEIDEESTFAYQMQQQTNQIIEKSNEQIKLLAEQNVRLENNYNKLEELYNLKDKELQEAKQGEKRAKVYNIIMMVITIISMLVAVAAWLRPNVLGGGV